MTYDNLSDVQKLMVDERISTEGYPPSEARFLSIQEWEKHTGVSWDKYTDWCLIKKWNPQFLKENPKCEESDCCGGDCVGVPSITYDGD